MTGDPHSIRPDGADSDPDCEPPTRPVLRVEDYLPGPEDPTRPVIFLPPGSPVVLRRSPRDVTSSSPFDGYYDLDDGTGDSEILPTGLLARPSLDSHHGAADDGGKSQARAVSGFAPRGTRHPITCTPPPPGSLPPVAPPPPGRLALERLHARPRGSDPELPATTGSRFRAVFPPPPDDAPRGVSASPVRENPAAPCLPGSRPIAEWEVAFPVIGGESSPLAEWGAGVEPNGALLALAADRPATAAPIPLPRVATSTASGLVAAHSGPVAHRRVPWLLVFFLVVVGAAGAGVASYLARIPVGEAGDSPEPIAHGVTSSPSLSSASAPSQPAAAPTQPAAAPTQPTQPTGDWVAPVYPPVGAYHNRNRRASDRRVNRARAAWDAGDFDAAQRALTDALVRDSRNPRALAEQARFAMSQGDGRGARFWAEAAVAVRPRSVDSALLLAEACGLAGDRACVDRALAVAADCGASAAVLDGYRLVPGTEN